MSTGQSVVVEGVTLELPVHTRRRKPGAQGVVVKDVGGRLEQRDSDHALIRALSDVSFAVEPGQRIGLIGHNGAGKSSLLRVIAGIYPPTRGTVHVEGRVSTLFSSSIGFNLNATGYENILLMGILLGVGRQRIQSLVPAIAEFSELGDFLEMPLRSYSAGMRTRLGFAIATSISPECLLIDEVLGAGDTRFQKKAKQRLDELMSGAYTLLLASHSMSTINLFCDRALWLEHGQLRSFGPVDEVTKAFLADQDAGTGANRKARHAEPGPTSDDG